jgi:6-pyruvoyltetrahydropterin/6-carboxytetrahydropterin synthase
MTQPLGTAPAPTTAPHMELFAEFRFEAAHRLPGVPQDHICARLHGHSYSVRISVVGPVDARTGWVTDFSAISGAVEPVRAGLDHRYLNEIEGLSNPTSENLASWLWHRLQPAIPGLSSIEVREMPGLGCIYRGPGSLI